MSMTSVPSATPRGNSTVLIWSAIWAPIQAKTGMRQQMHTLLPKYVSTPATPCSIWAHGTQEPASVISSKLITIILSSKE